MIFGRPTPWSQKKRMSSPCTVDIVVIFILHRRHCHIIHLSRRTKKLSGDGEQHRNVVLASCRRDDLSLICESRHRDLNRLACADTINLPTAVAFYHVYRCYYTATVVAGIRRPRSPSTTNHPLRPGLRPLRSRQTARWVEERTRVPGVIILW